jgi:hypothetical protein
MLDFRAVRNKEISMEAFIEDFQREDLVKLTNEMVDIILKLIHGCLDADVVFVPDDPDAYDPFAEDEEDIDLSWTLGHVIVHINASMEESAVLAAELARGVAFHGRSRYEVPWQSVTTIKECRERIKECRRICLASLDMWPISPHLDNTYQSHTDGPQINAIGRYVYGLMHTDSHLEQIEDIVHQVNESK